MAIPFDHLLKKTNTECTVCGHSAKTTQINNKWFCDYHLVELGWCLKCDQKFVENHSSTLCDKCYFNDGEDEEFDPQSKRQGKNIEEQKNNSLMICGFCGEYINKCKFCDRNVESCQSCSYDEYKSVYCDWCI